MAIKLLFLAGSALLWLHWLPATDVANSYSTVTCHRFRNASRATVYDFVTYSDLVDKVCRSPFSIYGSKMGTTALHTTLLSLLFPPNFNFIPSALVTGAHTNISSRSKPSSLTRWPAVTGTVFGGAVYCQCCSKVPEFTALFLVVK